MVTIIDYGIGNLRSIEKAFEHTGVRVLRTDSPEAVAAAEHLVLPGVGAFGACIAEVRRRGLVTPIRDAIDRGVPFLGVCVGMQMLFEVGLEGGHHEGLGTLPGRVERFSFSESSALKVPQIGWNQVEVRQDTPLLSGAGTAPWCYFVHSFRVIPADPGDVIATTAYGVDYASVVGRGNVYGVQFHPEKSQRSGLRILSNFAALS